MKTATATPEPKITYQEVRDFADKHLEWEERRHLVEIYQDSIISAETRELGIVYSNYRAYLAGKQAQPFWRMVTNWIGVMLLCMVVFGFCLLILLLALLKLESLC